MREVENNLTEKIRRKFFLILAVKDIYLLSEQNFTNEHEAITSANVCSPTFIPERRTITIHAISSSV